MKRTLFWLFSGHQVATRVVLPWVYVKLHNASIFSRLALDCMAYSARDSPVGTFLEGMVIVILPSSPNAQFAYSDIRLCIKLQNSFQAVVPSQKIWRRAGLVGEMLTIAGWTWSRSFREMAAKKCALGKLMPGETSISYCMLIYCRNSFKFVKDFLSPPGQTTYRRKVRVGRSVCACSPTLFLHRLHGHWSAHVLQSLPLRMLLRWCHVHESKRPRYAVSRQTSGANSTSVLQM